MCILNKCKDCGKEVSTKNTKRCKPCASKGSNNPNFGNRHSEETKQLMREKKIGLYDGKNNPMFGIHRIGKDSTNYKFGETLKKHYCKDCKIVEIAYTTFKNGEGRCKSCARKYEYKDPSNHPMWQGGISFEPYSIDFTEFLKRQIRNRDNHKCQYCYIKEITSKRLLDVHHIDYNKTNCKEENLISLCLRCHLKTQRNRDYWFAYFKYIVKNIYLFKAGLK